jgi:site-specific DNA-cytosine methylase
MIGNSVPPRFMQAIAEHVRDNILMADKVNDGN